MMGVHKYLVNDAVRADFGVFSFSIFQDFRHQQDFGCTLQKFKTCLHNINFSHLWNYQNTFSKKRLLHSVIKKLKNSYINFWKDKIHDDSKKST